jgi:hypothetical protein
MKKLLVISIAILFLYNTVGYLIVFKSFQYGIKEEIKSRIKNNLADKDIVLVKFPLNPDKEQQKLFNWKEDNEFTYNGNMYDVVRKSIVNDTIYYYCINDTKEKDLFGNLDIQVDQNMASNALANNLVKLFKLSVDQSYIFNFSKEAIIQSSKATVSIFILPCYIQVQSDVEIQPPELDSTFSC